MRKHYIKILQPGLITSVASAAMFAGATVFATVEESSTTVEVTVEVPQECQFIEDGIYISGSATADAPPGNLDKYHVQIDWGDGNTVDETEESPFGSGHGESTRDFRGLHVYDSEGVYTITARIYHQTLPGNDMDADDTWSVEVCISESNPDLGSIYGYKYEDLEGDDENQVLAGWTIWLFHGKEAKSTVTDKEGMYWFGNLEPDEQEPYKVCEELQDGWVQTYPYEMHDGEVVDCDKDSLGKWGYELHIKDNTEYQDYDFGNVELENDFR